MMRNQPMDWVCAECGATSEDAAVTRPATMDWMGGTDYDLLGHDFLTGKFDGDDEALFLGYGVFYDEATDEIILCGECGCARWNAPDNPETVKGDDDDA